MEVKLQKHLDSIGYQHNISFKVNIHFPFGDAERDKMNDYFSIWTVGLKAQGTMTFLR